MELVFSNVLHQLSSHELADNLLTLFSIYLRKFACGTCVDLKKALDTGCF